MDEKPSPTYSLFLHRQGRGTGSLPFHMSESTKRKWERAANGKRSSNFVKQIFTSDIGGWGRTFHFNGNRGKRVMTKWLGTEDMGQKMGRGGQGRGGVSGRWGRTFDLKYESKATSAWEEWINSPEI